eukprot:2967809-Ditylum_brightwellii.AAC.1
MEWEQHPARNSHAEMEGIGGFHSLQNMGWIGSFPSIQSIHLTWDSIVMSCCSLCPYVPPPFKQNLPHSASTQQRDLKPYA